MNTISLPQAILAGVIMAGILSYVSYCTATRFVEIEQHVEKQEKAAEEAWCASQVHKYSQAYIIRHISSIEKEILAERGAAIWWFDGSKYPGKGE